MGVNQGVQVDLSPKNLQWETLMQIVPPDFVTFKNFKDQIARITFTMQKNAIYTVCLLYTSDAADE